MKYIVNDGCIGCGLCEGTCPEVFSMTDAGVSEGPAECRDVLWRRDEGRAGGGEEPPGRNIQTLTRRGMAKPECSGKPCLVFFISSGACETPERMHSLTAPLAIIGDWGRPQRRKISADGREGRKLKSCICIDKCPASPVCVLKGSTSFSILKQYAKHDMVSIRN